MVLEEVMGVVIREPDHVFTISQTSTWMHYINRAKLWDGKPKPGLPSSPEEAKKAAGKFLTALAQAFRDAEKYPFLRQFEGCDFIPPLAKVVDVNYVSTGEETFTDHVLVRYQTAMYGDDAFTRVPVLGASIEVRIGEFGEILGWNSRWSLLHKKFIRTPLVDFVMPEDGHTHDHDAEADEAQPVLAYVLGGDNVPQYLLAPYYLTMSGHHFTEASASAYSLTARFGFDHRQGSSRVEAQVSGGSGKYSYHWSWYKIEEVMHKGIVDVLDDNPILTIPESCFAWVCCHIVDQKTNAYYFHTEQSIGLPVTTEDEPINLTT